MAELNKIHFLPFFLLIIFPAHALDVIFSNALEDFKQQSEINTYFKDGHKKYVGTLKRLTYQPEPDTSKVIVYIIDRSRLVEIIRNAVRDIRLQIAYDLKELHCELVFLGIDNFDDDEYHLIGGFIADKIRRDPNQMNLTVETIGEKRFDRFYHHSISGLLLNFGKHQENAQIGGETLKERLRNIPRGALKPVESDDKEIKLYGFHPTVKEVKWTVSVENGTYSPKVNVSDSKHNFRLRYKAKILWLLILGGKEYSAVTNYGKRMSTKSEMSDILNVMTRKNEGLIILGAFNFDWTEMDIVTQIILKHSEGSGGYLYNVFTHGYGMFNTAYLDENEVGRRNILQPPKSNALKVINILLGEEIKERAIDLYYSDDDGWGISKEPINLINGRYLPAEGSSNFTFQWVDKKIAFIVYDATESNDRIDIRMVYQSMEELKQSGIHVVLIKAINFCLDDIHIIAEWIDCHRGVIDSEHIAVMGGGIFDTMFQSKLTTYSTSLNTKSDELKNIRNTFVNKCNGKTIFATQIDDPNCEVWTYPMNTINGVYEPDLIPDKNVFDTTDKKKILFLVTSANHFYRIASVKNMEPIYWLRDRIEKYYLYSEWSIFLVGLDNLGDRDDHLFAELVRMQTNYGRYLEQYVCTFNYAIGYRTYQYKDTPPLPVDTRPRIESYMKSYFGIACRNINDEMAI